MISLWLPWNGLGRNFQAGQVHSERNLHEQSMNCLLEQEMGGMKCKNKRIEGKLRPNSEGGWVKISSTEIGRTDGDGGG
jgi:hypothetical protein